MNTVQTILRQRFLYGGEVKTLGAIYADLQAIVAQAFPHDRRAQNRVINAYIAGLMQSQPEPIADDAPTTVIDGRTFLAQ